MNSRHATTLYGERPAMTHEEQPRPVRHKPFIRTNGGYLAGAQCELDGSHAQDDDRGEQVAAEDDQAECAPGGAGRGPERFDGRHGAGPAVGRAGPRDGPGADGDQGRARGQDPDRGRQGGNGGYQRQARDDGGGGEQPGQAEQGADDGGGQDVEP
jgi:hypothetical protein